MCFRPLILSAPATPGRRSPLRKTATVQIIAGAPPAPAIFLPSVPLLLTAFRVIHRASEYALHLPGRAFFLLGVLLEGSLANRHNIPPPRALPLQVSNRPQIDLRPLFGTATLPTGTSVASSRGEGGLLTALRHGHPAHKPLSGIPAWRRGLLTGLQHGDPTHRYLRAIPAWRRGLLTGLRHGHQAYKYLRGILAWRRWSSISARP